LERLKKENEKKKKELEERLEKQGKEREQKKANYIWTKEGERELKTKKKLLREEDN